MRNLCSEGEQALSIVLSIGTWPISTQKCSRFEENNGKHRTIRPTSSAVFEPSSSRLQVLRDSRSHVGPCIFDLENKRCYVRRFQIINSIIQESPISEKYPRESDIFHFYNNVFFHMHSVLIRPHEHPTVRHPNYTL